MTRAMTSEVVLPARRVRRRMNCRGSEPLCHLEFFQAWWDTDRVLKC